MDGEYDGMQAVENTSSYWGVLLKDSARVFSKLSNIMQHLESSKLRVPIIRSVLSGAKT